MKTVISLPEVRTARAGLPEPVGFVPTMGYLHKGHLALVQQAKRDCVSVVASIFVNPTQFGPNEDLGSYPRDLPHDLSLLDGAGVDLVWTPSPEVMYPPGFQTWVNVEKLTQGLEGASRPGHFRGVATVVAKLFNAVRPQRAYFGQKDAQQAAVVQRLAKDLDFPVEIVVCPIYREPDGLAMSSRNSYLNPMERQAAAILFRSLGAAKNAYEKGEKRASALCQVVRTVISTEPLADLQYVACTDAETLEELEIVQGKALLSLAVHLGKTRLIDNILLE